MDPADECKLCDHPGLNHDVRVSPSGEAHYWIRKQRPEVKPMPETTTGAPACPTWEEALTAAARNLDRAEKQHSMPEVAEASARIADRWLTLAARLMP